MLKYYLLYIKQISRIIYSYKIQHIFGFVILIMTGGLSFAIPLLTMSIIDNALMSNDINMLIRLVITIFLLNSIINILSVLSSYIYTKLGKRIVVNFRMEILRHIFELSGSYFIKMKTGDMLALLQRDVWLLENTLTHMFPNMIKDIVITIGTIVVLVYLNPILTTIVVIIQIIIVVVQNCFSKMMRDENRSVFKHNASSNSILQELISSIINVIVIKGKRYFLKRFLNNERQLMKTYIRMDIVNSVGLAIVSELCTIINGIVFFMGGLMVIRNIMTIGALVIFINYSNRLISPLMSVFNSIMQLQQTFISMERINCVLDQTSEVYRHPSGICNKIIGEIIFENVDFSYKDTNKVLNDISFKISRGDIVAIVGVSGSGKSTICHLLMRLWDVKKGKIKVDNINIVNYNLEYLRKSIAIVSQEIVLFDDTIYNNLTLYNKKLDYDYILECVKIADAYDFIEKLPEKFNTIIGEKGMVLSGGQRQRLSLARALLLNSPIIIFDEAFASLDNISFNSIMQNIIKLDKTVIVISHILTHIKDIPNIYVISEGRITEKGTHDQLVEINGFYSSLYKKQIERVE